MQDGDADESRVPEEGRASTAGNGGEGGDELMRLASIVAHQLKSPLSAVQTVLGSVLGGFTGPLEPRQRWLLQKAWQRCSDGMGMVSDLVRLRTLERLEDGALAPVNMMTALSAAVEGAQEKSREREQDLDVAFELGNVDSAWVHGDAGIVREILSVILDNAVKYTPRGGSIGVRLILEEREGDPTPWVATEVVDTGIGIPAEGYDNLFQEFYRAPNAKKMASEGTGLGLAFARRAARRLGGEIEVEPAETGGVRAVVRFAQRPDYAGRARAGVVPGGPREEEREVSQRVVIVGGVAAGSKAAARIMRLDPAADVTVVERGRFLAYAGCGLPYYISGAVTDQRMLLETPLGALRDPAFFHELKNVRTLDQTEVVRIDRAAKKVVVRSGLDGAESELAYDKLVLATGARPLVPELPGVGLEGIHTLHGVEDAEAIRGWLRRPQVKDVVIVGGGLLGSQITEAVALGGARITLVEERTSIVGILDEDLALLVRRHLESQGIRVLTNTRLESFDGDTKVGMVKLRDGSQLECDFVILAMGREPDVDLARACGLEIGDTGALRVDDRMRTSDESIYAAGDCTEQLHRVTGQPVWMPGAASAAIGGRVAADEICGLDERFPGVVGSVILQLFGWTVGRTGLTETAAQEAGLDTVIALVPGPDHAHFLETAQQFVFKLVADRATGRILGAQAIGPGHVAKRIDVIATALSAGMDVDDLAHLHLAYAPPFSQAMDTVVTAANVIRNKMDGLMDSIRPQELWQLMMAGETPLLLDVRQPGEYDTVRLRESRHVPLGALRGRLTEIPRDRPVVVVCSIGLRSYEAGLILKDHGFESVKVLDGGLDAWPYPAERLT